MTLQQFLNTVPSAKQYYATNCLPTGKSQSEWIAVPGLYIYEPELIKDKKHSLIKVAKFRIIENKVKFQTNKGTFFYYFSNADIHFLEDLIY